MKYHFKVFCIIGNSKDFQKAANGAADGQQNEASGFSGIITAIAMISYMHIVIRKMKLWARIITEILESKLRFWKLKFKV